MTEGVEQGLEMAFAGLLFSMAIALLLWMHGAFLHQAQKIGSTPERLILMEEKGDEGWKLWEEPLP